MASNLHAQLQSLKQQVAAIEAKLAKSNRKLLGAPAKYGFKSMDAFIDALRAASGGGSAGASPVKGGGRKKRAKITPEMKNEVRNMVKAEKTGAEIAKALGISLPSVQNIKKELGLVRKK